MIEAHCWESLQSTAVKGRECLRSLYSLSDEVRVWEDIYQACAEVRLVKGQHKQRHHFFFSSLGLSFFSFFVTAYKEC